MNRIALLAAGLLVTLVLAAPIGATSSVTKLTGTVGPGFTITLKKGTYKYICAPHATVMLLWLARSQPGALAEGKRQLRLVRKEQPASPLAREAKRLLAGLEGV